jgi:hypothetical protein
LIFASEETAIAMAESLEEEFRAVGDDEHDDERNRLVNSFDGAPHKCIGQENVSLEDKIISTLIKT